MGINFVSFYDIVLNLGTVFLQCGIFCFSFYWNYWQI